MIPEFPHHLASLSDKGMNDSIQKNVIVSEFESGPNRIAPLSSVATRVRKLTYTTCSKADFLALQKWYVKDIRCGALHFLWKDFMDGEWKRVRMIPGDFAGSPTDADQEKWEIAFSIESIEEY